MDGEQEDTAKREGRGAGGEGWGQICLMTSDQNEFLKKKRTKLDDSSENDSDSQMY